MMDTTTVKEIGLAELFGLKGQRIIWGRLVTFLVANLVAQMVFVVQAIVTIPKGAQVSPPLEYWVSNLIVPVILCLAVLIGLRWIADEWAGAAAAALSYTILMTSVRLLFYRGYHLNGSIINTFLWPLLTLIGLILALRLCRSLFQALLYSSIVTGVLLSLLYQCIQLLIFRRPNVHFSIDLGSELLGIFSSVLFALVFWSGLRLKWCQPQLLGSAPMVVSSATTAITDDPLPRILDFNTPRTREELAILLKELEANTFTRRLKAAAALGKLGSPAALPALERMSHGTDDLWVLFDDGMRARARIAYPSGFIPGTDKEMLWRDLGGTNDQLKRAAKAAIAQIQETAGTATPEEAAMKVVNDAYLVRHNPELDEAVAKALNAIHASSNGLTTLLDRLCDGVVITSGGIRLANWGDMTWNELLKKRAIIKCFQRAKDGRAVSKLRELLQAECSYGQWMEIVRPALREAVDAIEA